MSFYNGVRLTHETVDGRDWSRNANTLSLDTETVLDIPPPFDRLDTYAASLGHKANHHVAACRNAMYDVYWHPRFGAIKCLRTLREVQAGEEILVDYGYGRKEDGAYDAPSWYQHLHEN